MQKKQEKVTGVLSTPAQSLIDIIAAIYIFDATICRVLRISRLVGVDVAEGGDRKGYIAYLYAIMPSIFTTEFVKTFAGIAFSLKGFAFYPIVTLLQSIMIGFENRMAYGVGKRIKGSDTTLSDLEQSCLRIYHETQEYVEKTSEAAEIRQGLGVRFMEFYNEITVCFWKSYEGIMERSGRIVEHADGVLDGSDWVYSPTEAKIMLGKEFREVCSYDRWDENTKSFWSKLRYELFKTADRIPAFGSAACSAFFVGIDKVGRQVGNAFASCVINYFGDEKFFEGSNAKNIIIGDRILLSITYLIHETYWVMGSLLCGGGSQKALGVITKYLRNIFYETTYFPIVSGIMIGCYEELALQYPDDLSKFQEKIQEDNPHGESVLKIHAASLTSKSLWQLVIDCYEQARREYEKYDEIYESYRRLANEDVKLVDKQTAEKRERILGGSDSRMRRGLVKNAPGVKRILEARRAFLWTLSSISDLVGDHKKHLKTTVLVLRASVLWFQLLFSKALFSGAKLGTKFFIEHPQIGKAASAVVYYPKVVINKLIGLTAELFHRKKPDRLTVDATSGRESKMGVGIKKMHEE